MDYIYLLSLSFARKMGRHLRSFVLAMKHWARVSEFYEERRNNMV